jgi:aryl sulfotransferase
VVPDPSAETKDLNPIGHSPWLDLRIEPIDEVLASLEGQTELPSVDIREYYRYFLEHDGSLPGFIEEYRDHVRGWWQVREHPNVLFVHFDKLKSDLEGQIRRIAELLGVAVDAAQGTVIAQHASFDYMQREFEQLELMEQFFQGGGKTFIFKGTNGRWRDVLSEDEIAQCDAAAANALSPECAHWLKTGDWPA